MILFYLITADQLAVAEESAPQDALGQPIMDLRFSLDQSQAIVGADWTPDASSVPGTLLGDNFAAMAYMADHSAAWYQQPSL